MLRTIGMKTSRAQLSTNMAADTASTVSATLRMPMSTGVGSGRGGTGTSLVLPFIIAVRLEGGEATAWQGATTKNIEHICGRSNAARRDASPAECHRNYESQHLARSAMAELRAFFLDGQSGARLQCLVDRDAGLRSLGGGHD